MRRGFGVPRQALSAQVAMSLNHKFAANIKFTPHQKTPPHQPQFCITSWDIKREESQLVLIR
jgi:hypothetical protein